MPAAQRVFVTHITSPGTDSATFTASGPNSPSSIAIASVSPYAAGDVILMTSGPTAGQRSIIGSVGAGSITLSPALSTTPNAGDTFLITRARTVTDASANVLRISLRDYLDGFTQSCTIELSDYNDQYSTLFEARDPVEVWIDDGNDADTPAVTMPSSTSDNAHDAGRCFVGRIDTIQREYEAGGWRVILTCRDYMADLFDALVDSVFLDYALVDASPTTNVLGLLTADFNARRGSLKDTAAGQPTFALGVPDVTNFTVTVTSIAFITEPFFDAFARIAEATLDLGTTPQGLVFFVDNFTYHPRQAGTRPTLQMLSRASAAGASIAWNIQQGSNVLDASPARESDRTRNYFRVAATDKNGVPILTIRRQTNGTGDVLGTDRFGQIEGLATPTGALDPTGLTAAATQALSRTSVAMERRSVKRIGVIEPGRRLSGALVTTLLPIAGVPATTSLGIAGVTHTFAPEGVTSDFDLTLPRPGWSRIIAPLAKSVQATLKEDVYATFYLYSLGNGPTNYSVYRWNPQEFGDTFVYLFDVPTRAGKNGVSISVYNGKLAILYDDGVVNIVDAVTGATIPILQNLNLAGGSGAGGWCGVHFADETETSLILYVRGTQDFLKWTIDKTTGATVTPGAVTDTSFGTGYGLFVRSTDDANREEIAYTAGRVFVTSKMTLLNLNTNTPSERQDASGTSTRFAWDRRALAFFWDPNGDGILRAWKLPDFGDGPPGTNQPDRSFIVSPTALLDGVDFEVVPVARFYY